MDRALESHPGELSGAVDDFMGTCDYGGIDVSGVVKGFKQWLKANENDAAWASTVAEAFEDAGANGSEVGAISNGALQASLRQAGVSPTRETLDIDPPRAWGGQPTTGFVNDPVNSATGNFLEPENDLPCVGACELLSIRRMYNSLNPGRGIFGAGWSSSLEVTLRLGDDGAHFVQDDGREVFFPQGVDHERRAVGENYWLTRAKKPVLERLGLPFEHAVKAHWVVKDNTGGWWAFTASGTWLGAGRGPGNSTWVTRGDHDEVTRISHERGKWVEVDYTDGLVSRLRASDGRVVDYLYEGGDQLRFVLDSTGKRTYEWNDDGLIYKVIDVNGVVECINTYDAHRRVVQQVSEFGRRIRFSYLRGRVTEVADHDGTYANTWIADQLGRVVAIIDSNGARQSMSYDPWGNLVMVRDRENQLTTHSYDDRGRRITTRTTEGGHITFGYDDYDRITTVVTSSGGMITYGYADDVERNPSTVKDPGG
ncbi:MAG TPA: DUF6531 domain-containing protein, partial [Beutenbergiaceae bacterium]|nr:DUF6531 domain-containing protein [Beutenbergiaceae bacterium]